MHNILETSSMQVASSVTEIYLFIYLQKFIDL